MIKLPKLTEKQFQAKIIRLAQIQGWTVYHTYDSRRSEPGFPDLVLAREKILYRELKTDTGTLTPPQKKWGEILTNAGGDYAVWRPSMSKIIISELERKDMDR